MPHYSEAFLTDSAIKSGSVTLFNFLVDCRALKALSLKPSLAFLGNCHRGPSVSFARYAFSTVTAVPEAVTISMSPCPSTS